MPWSVCRQRRAAVSAQAARNARPSASSRSSWSASRCRSSSWVHTRAGVSSRVERCSPNRTSSPARSTTRPAAREPCTAIGTGELSTSHSAPPREVRPPSTAARIGRISPYSGRGTYSMSAGTSPAVQRSRRTSRCALPISSWWPVFSAPTASASVSVIVPVGVWNVVSSTRLRSAYRRSVRPGSTGVIDQCPASWSSSRAKQDGLSNRGQVSQSTEPDRVTRAAEWQSDSRACSAIGMLLIWLLQLTIRRSRGSIHGLGLVSGPRRYRVGALRRVDVGRTEASEQEAVLFAEGVQPKADRPGQAGSAEYSSGGPADQVRRDGQAQLVEQPGRGKLAVEAGSALGLHGSEAIVGETADGPAEVDILVTRDQHVGDVGGLTAVSRGRAGDGDDDRAGDGGGKQRRGPVQPAGPGHDRDRHGRRPVVFGAERARGDQYDVGRPA